MRQLTEYIARVRQMSPGEFLQKSSQLAQKKGIKLASKAYFSGKTSFFQGEISWEPPRFMPPEKSYIEEEWPKFEKSLEYLFEHKFDLLGSGWTQVNSKDTQVENKSCKQTKKINANSFNQINRANRKICKQLSEKVDSHFSPIDWSRDFKSNFRWSLNTWWDDVQYGQPGVDIKVPWELSRMQHLPWLSLGYIKSGNSKYVDEFQNQVLDFISKNPPRFGVNWKSPMEAAIRASNWIVTFDLFRNSDYTFGEEFSSVLAKNLYDHGLFIFQNLEKLGDQRSNHYLANIVGLIFISHSLCNNKDIEAWRHFSRQELLNELEHQFHPIGTNFEGSTAYHRLSSELLNYGLLNITLADGSYDFIKDNPALLEKIVGSSIFAEAITKPNGEFVQIGDNDSGRFLKINPTWNSVDQSENYLDNSHLSAFKNAFLNRWIVEIESALIVRSLEKLALAPDFPVKDIEKTILQKIQNNFENSLPLSPTLATDKKEYIFDFPEITTTDLEAYYFADFGVVIYKNEDFFLSFRCGSIGQNGRGGHDHNDQLSIELFANKKSVIADPGTAIYSPNKSKRIQYRSNKFHFTPQPKNREMADIQSALFFLGNSHPGELFSFTKNSCIGFFEGFDQPVMRQINIEDNRLIIRDYSFNNQELWNLEEFEPLEFSRGYGFPQI